jgi:hypothetical protein
MAVVRPFLICCVVLFVGCAGMRSVAPHEEQGHTEATKEQEGSSSGAASSEEARCSQTRTFKDKESGWLITTNDIPGCPNGGMLSGTDGRDKLSGNKGEDEIRGLGGSDFIFGGDGNDVIYGGPGDDNLKGFDGEDVIYGGPGDDKLDGGPSDAVLGGPGELLPGGGDGQRDKIYCGEGRDSYWADKEDYVDSSCEVKLPNSLRFPKEPTAQDLVDGGGPASGSPVPVPPSGGPAILLLAAALLLGSGILTYAILRRR